MPRFFFRAYAATGAFHTFVARQDGFCLSRLMLTEHHPPDTPSYILSSSRSRHAEQLTVD